MDELDITRNEDSIRKLKTGLEAGSEELFQLILDPDLQFVKLLLKNRHITEDHLLALLKRKDLSAEIIGTIFKRNQQSLSHKLLLAIVRNSATDGALVRNLLPQLRLFELVDLCNLPGASADQKLAAERVILQRLPTTPLGNKITLARRGSANIVAELLKEGHPRLFEVCLSNPRLKEAAIFQFLRGATANAETISQVARHSRWKERPNLKLAILKNPRTPDIWFTLWLPRIPLHLLKQLQTGSRTNPARKNLIDAEIKKRFGR